VRAHDALDAAHALPFASLDQLFGRRGLVVVAPHPDDESLGCGGLVATAVAERRPIRIVIVSDGTGSHPNSRTWPAPRLRDLREAEARQAMQELGGDPDHLIFLRLPDRFVPARGAAAETATDAIVRAACSIDAAGLFVTWRHDPHGDHQAAFALAHAAQRRLPEVRLYEYSVWGSTLPPETPVEPVTRGFRLPIELHRDCKRRAILAHRSQTSALIDDDPEGFRLTAADLARFDLPYECFIGSAT
jgi:LmbE family N-acetylglucosaminyl deacetylase